MAAEKNGRYFTMIATGLTVFLTIVALNLGMMKYTLSCVESFKEKYDDRLRSLEQNNMKVLTQLEEIMRRLNSIDSKIDKKTE